MRKKKLETEDTSKGNKQKQNKKKVSLDMEEQQKVFVRETFFFQVNSVVVECLGKVTFCLL